MKPAATMMFLPRTTAVACLHAPGLHIVTAVTAPDVSGSPDATTSSSPSGLPLIGRVLVLAVIAASALTAPARAWAQALEAAPSTPISGVTVGAAPSAAGPCVQVDVGGYRAGHLDCAIQALQAAARQSQARARSGVDAPVAGATDVRLGVASLAGAGLRMGPNLGVSAQAWRPPRFAPPARP